MSHCEGDLRNTRVMATDDPEQRRVSYTRRDDIVTRGVIREFWTALP
jgi:hypothetical protein